MFFDIDTMSRVPLYEQLYRQVIEGISRGLLREEDRLPSVRSLATQLSVNPNTVAKAYSLLERDGIICTVAGRGSFIAKPNQDVVQRRLLEDFDRAAQHALSAGVKGETLQERLATLIQTKGDDEP